MADETKMDKLDQYLLGELKGEELKAFEQEMINDEDLSKDLDLHKAVFEAVSEKEIIDYRAELDKIQVQMDAGTGSAASDNQEVKPQATIRRLNIRRVLAVAASVAVLLVAGWYVMQSGGLGGPMTADEVFAANFEAPSIEDVASRSDDFEKPKMIDQFLDRLYNSEDNFKQSFKAKDYEAALKALNTMLGADSKFENHSEQTYYYNRGITLLHLENYKDAARAFNKVKRGEKLEDALWYKAMAYLKTDTTKAKETLAEISQRNGHPKAAQATKMLERME